MFVRLKTDFLGQKTGAQIDVSDEHGNALIEKGIAERVETDPVGPLMQKAMEGLFGNFLKAQNDALDTALKEFAKAQTLSRKNAIPAIFGDGGHGDPEAPTFGKFLLAVRRGDAN